ncbi:GIY-YIG nuclease family protein [Henriciella sp. AS95]|uniref:GIY-YIG nuclease family protein n=1 Tax=Henriciella sp. AS95 TaxID=3135782 RepID=UPI00317EFDA7
MDISSVRAALNKAKGPWYPKDHQGPGFYAIFLKSSSQLPGIDVPRDGLLYIGKTEKGFSARDHFQPSCGHSGHCTARRSLGALLSEQLDLKPKPRSRRSIYSRKSHFRFDAAGEKRLSEWMQGQLYIARVPFEGNVSAAEAMLIEGLRPPLNLTIWDNPQAGLVKRLRRQCSDQARSFFSRGARVA